MGDIDELLIKYLLNETSTEEQTQVQKWITEDPANETYYAHFKKIWETSKNLESVSQIDEEAAWKKFRSKVSAPAEQETVILPIRKKNYSWLKIAAVFLIAVGLWSTYRLYTAGNYTMIDASASIVTKTLPDGSVITLNKNAMMSYNSDFNNNRSIHLQKGEAFFKVTPNKEKPFIIDADKVSIRVVGTSFNVKHLKGETEVIVETGIVKVSIGDMYIELHKGEKVSVKDGATSLTKEINSDQLYSHYRSKLFILNNTPLWKFVGTLNEVYNANIAIQDPKVKEMTLNTTFKEESLETILQVVCSTLDIQQVRSQNGILLSKKVQHD
ncbi:FecR domain-containing protein [Pedobacter cryoconitis]|uniref:Ferric-dicitrate binding protein FerR (Iron transport regulator) n=1 Tax=Pedobacter cryoconitis TaxID=188932 RepID=A0A7X0MMG5_9SPHI|nr:FecR domain-containing protein [Pedobacter cryoconitis]MBB6502443.1 ferric-dicitrate binding protein FerR (iron transport regulator) [Pedobacter cryoconitis]